MNQKNQPTALSTSALLTDYDRWLDFIITSQQTIRQYDHQLARIERYYPDFKPMSSYLRDCMRHRTTFFSRIGNLLTDNVDRLRAHPANADQLARLRRAHPAIQLLINQLTEAFTEIMESYRNLPTVPSVSTTAFHSPSISIQSYS